MSKKDLLTGAPPTILTLKDAGHAAALPPAPADEPILEFADNTPDLEEEEGFETDFPETWNILKTCLESLLLVFTPKSMNHTKDRFCVLSYPDPDKPKTFTFGIPACSYNDLETLCGDLAEDEFMINSDVKRSLNHLCHLLVQQSEVNIDSFSSIDIECFFDEDETLMISTRKPLHLLLALGNILKNHNVYTIDSGFEHGFKDTSSAGQAAFFQEFVSEALTDPTTSDHFLNLMPARPYTDMRHAFNMAHIVNEIAHFHLCFANFEALIREELGYPKTTTSLLQAQADLRYFSMN